MKRMLSLLMAAALALTVISGLELPEKEYAFSACSTTEECDQQLAEIAKEKEKIQQKIDANNNDINTIMDQVLAYSDQIELIQNEANVIQSVIDVIQKDVDVISEKLAAKDEIVRERLVVQQQQKNSSTFLTILASSTSVSDLISKWSALNTLQNYDKEIMQEYYADKTQQLELMNTQEIKKTEIETKKAEIETSKGERQKVIDLIKEDMIKNSSALQELTTTAEDLDKQRELINLPEPDAPAPETPSTPDPTTPEEPNTEPGDNGNDNSSEGETPSTPDPTPVPPASWSLPVGGGAVITSYYRSQSYYNQFGSWHLGIDVANGYYSPIYAASKGRVLVSDSFCYEGNKSCNGAFGNLIVISHKDINGTPYVTLYAHLESVYVSVGDYVYGGNQIGTMGNTGGSYGAHLHFELHEGTELFYGDRGSRDYYTRDPLNYLPWRGSWTVHWDA